MTYQYIIITVESRLLVVVHMGGKHRNEQAVRILHLEVRRLAVRHSPGVALCVVGAARLCAAGQQGQLVARLCGAGSAFGRQLVSGVVRSLWPVCPAYL